MRPTGRATGTTAANRHPLKPLQEFGFVMIGLAAIALVGYVTIGALTTSRLPTGLARLTDFHTIWAAARSYLHARSPYPQPTLPGVYAVWFVYPPPAAALFVPFGLLPYGIAAPLMMGVLVIATAAGLWLLEVRDWRFYAAAALSPATLVALEGGTITPLLFLATAALWRCRDRKWIAATLAALAILPKLYLWPLAIWMLATRRVGMAARAAAIGAVLSAAAWGVIRFAGLSEYPTLLLHLTSREAAGSYSTTALLETFGVRSSALTVSFVGIASVAVILASRGDDGDRRGFIVAILASLLVTPIVWLHYFMLLFVPIALSAGRSFAAWMLPVMLWVTPTCAAKVSLIPTLPAERWRIIAALATVGCVLAVTLVRKNVATALALARRRSANFS